MWARHRWRSATVRRRRTASGGTVGVGGSGEDALPVDLDAEADHVQRFGGLVGVELVEGLVPGGQHFPGGRVAVAGPALPDRQVIAVLMKRNEADRTLLLYGYQFSQVVEQVKNIFESCDARDS